jgi:hypothetical protein
MSYELEILTIHHDHHLRYMMDDAGNSIKIPDFGQFDDRPIFMSSFLDF